MSGLQPTVQIEDNALKSADKQDPDRIEYGVDSRGRKIGVKRVSMFRRRMALNACSVENSQKPLYFNQALASCCCVSINGQEVDVPLNELQLAALMDRLDMHGYTCIVQVLSEQFAETDESVVKN